MRGEGGVEMADWGDQEQLSLAYVTAVAAAAGYSCVSAPRALDNAGVDLVLFDRTRPDPFPLLHLQVKSRQIHYPNQNKSISIDLTRRQFEMLRRGSRAIPCLLVLVLLPRDRREWLHVTNEQMIVRYSALWISLQGATLDSASSSVRVRFSPDQLFEPLALRGIINDVIEGWEMR